MKATADSTPRDPWPLARVLIFLLSGAFAGLLMDIRVEHVDAVRDRSVAWLPIAYAGFMAFACLAACVFWKKPTGPVMVPLFLLAMLIGAAGFYFHNHGNFMAVVRDSVAAWTDPKMSHSEGPPQVAPLAFAGLGAIGVLASLKRFRS